MTRPTPINGPRIRRAPIPDDAVLVVRGEPGPGVSDITRNQAQRFLRAFPDWGRYGLSAFYARDDTEVDDLSLNQLKVFETLRLIRMAALLDAGFEVVPTFRTPHVTIAFAGDLAEALERFANVEGDLRVNRYHQEQSDAPEGR